LNVNRISKSNLLLANMRLSSSAFILFSFIDVQYVFSLSVDQGETFSRKNQGENKVVDLDEVGSALEPHPDPNLENHNGMIYVGRHDEEGGTRIGFEHDNGVNYIFGTAFDESHKDIEEEDLRHRHSGADVLHDIADRKHGKTRAEVLKDRRHKKIDKTGPKPFGHVDTHPLDGGVIPPKVVRVEPFFLDEKPVTSKEFGKFVRSTYYESEAEKFGWSFVLSSFLPKADLLQNADVDPDAEHWVAVDGAYWRKPEGPGSTYKLREHHPVVHVTHRDAAEYCTWVGKRLPGEREYEAAARAGHYGPNNRTLYAWGDDDTVEKAKGYANLWGAGAFPDENKAEDGWRGTSPVKTFPPNKLGFYDTTGNVWEWMRGGKHKARIVRGASFVDSLDGSVNHAATLGARATLHGTTTTANVGFRCARSVKQRTEYSWIYHDEETKGQLGVEDNFGKQHAVPQHDWEDMFWVQESEDEVTGETRKKRKVAKPRTIVSSEL